MFKFNFVERDSEVDEAEGHGNVLSEPNTGNSGQHATNLKPNPLRELPLEELLDALPSIISYSTLEIPITGQTHKITLARRDLYDVRYQLFAQDEGESDIKDSKDLTDMDVTGDVQLPLAYVDNPSDLLPGVYEGGLKTWECSLDLVDVLEGKVKAERGAGWMPGKRFLEIGCGTAIPSLYILQQLFHESKADAGTDLIFQDFNDLVLRLVTFPNVFLTWYTSLAAEHLRESQSLSEKAGDSGDNIVTVSQDLKDAFLQSLKERNTTIQFIAGSWDVFVDENGFFLSPFDVVVTSETIYNTSSLPSLIALLKRACRATDKDSVVEGVENLSLQSKDTLCLVAAKVLYFGVGGGIVDFEARVNEVGGLSEALSDKPTGVGRRVLSLYWRNNQM